MPNLARSCERVASSASSFLFFFLFSRFHRRNERSCANFDSNHPLRFLDTRRQTSRVSSLSSQREREKEKRVERWMIFTKNRHANRSNDECDDVTHRSIPTLQTRYTYTSCFHDTCDHDRVTDIFTPRASRFSPCFTIEIPSKEIRVFFVSHEFSKPEQRSLEKTKRREKVSLSLSLSALKNGCTRKG